MIGYVLLGLLLWGFYEAGCWVIYGGNSFFDHLKARRQHRREQRDGRQALNQQQLLDLRQQELHRKARLNQRRSVKEQSHKLQVALSQIPRSNDFQRVAFIAAKCKELPLAFRRRQFVRFKPLIAEHIYRRLSLGEKPKVLLSSLKLLLKQLALPEYEADYLMQNVMRRQKLQNESVKPASFASRFEVENQLHSQRVETIKASVPEEELVEQLLEEEQLRHEAALLKLTTGRRPGDDHQAIDL